MKKTLTIIIAILAMQLVMAQGWSTRCIALAKAIAEVESSNNDSAVNGNCVGWLQLSPIMVAEANRLMGAEFFNLSDRWDRLTSFTIFQIIMENRNPTLSVRIACQLWNPGAGEWYYRKVKKAYDRIIKTHPKTI